MSENKTDETKNPRSFEERVFARFDAVDSRLDAVDSRLGALENRVGKLESKRYDTKPIWEQALASIAETNQKLAETNQKLAETNERMDRGFDLLRNEMKAEFSAVRNEMKTEFTAVRHEIEHSLRGVDRKIDVLNQNIFNFQVDQRYVDRRLAELESQIKPT